MPCLFNSFDPYFKQPFGAVRAGQSVHLSLCIPEELGYVDPHLVLQKEGRYDVPVHYRMKFDGQTPHQNHFSVDAVHNGADAYEYAVSGGYDAVILDVMMPRMNGIQVLGRLRAERIMERVWGWDNEAEINVVWVNISNLRKKLRAIGSRVTLRANRGLGYVLEEET